MLYEYECPVHGHFERRVPVDDRDQVACSCGAQARRLPNLSVQILIPPYMRAGFDGVDPFRKVGGVKNSKQRNLSLCPKDE